MPEILHLLGSSLWLEQVFAGPPAVAFRGRIEPTRLHRYIETLGIYVGAQGARICRSYCTCSFLPRQHEA